MCTFLCICAWSVCASGDQWWGSRLHLKLWYRVSCGTCSSLISWTPRLASPRICLSPPPQSWGYRRVHCHYWASHWTQALLLVQQVLYWLSQLHTDLLPNISVMETGCVHLWSRMLEDVTSCHVKAYSWPCRVACTHPINWNKQNFVFAFLWQP